MQGEVARVDLAVASLARSSRSHGVLYRGQRAYMEPEYGEPCRTLVSLRVTTER
jgi:hypothetical protein